MRNDKKEPIKLSLKIGDVAKYKLGNMKFTTAHFS